MAMGLEFPNRSRSYDPGNKRIRFTGHDGMFEIAFSIDADALSSDIFDAAEAESAYLKRWIRRRRSFGKLRAQPTNEPRDILTPSPLLT